MRLLTFALAFIAGSAAAELPPGYWDTNQSQVILDVTLEVTLAPDLSQLTAAESQAVLELLAAGQVRQALYEGQRHHEAPAAKQALLRLHDDSGRTSGV